MSDVFDLLLSMGDFMAFKEVMLAYRKETQTVRPWDVNYVSLGGDFLAYHGVVTGHRACQPFATNSKATASLDYSLIQESSDLLRVDVTRAHIHAEEQEEGEERPELDFCLQISPAGSKLQH